MATTGKTSTSKVKTDSTLQDVDSKVLYQAGVDAIACVVNLIALVEKQKEKAAPLSITNCSAQLYANNSVTVSIEYTLPSNKSGRFDLSAFVANRPQLMKLDGSSKWGGSLNSEVGKYEAGLSALRGGEALREAYVLCAYLAGKHFSGLGVKSTACWLSGLAAGMMVDRLKKAGINVKFFYQWESKAESIEEIPGEYFSHLVNAYSWRYKKLLAGTSDETTPGSSTVKGSADGLVM